MNISEKEIRAAVGMGKERIDFLNSRKRITDTIPYAKAATEQTLSFLPTLVETCESVLAASECLPEKIHIDERDRDVDCTKIDVQLAINETLDLCTATLAKKLVGLEEVLKARISFECNCDCDIRPCLKHRDNEAFKELATAIKTYLGSKENCEKI